MTRFDHILRLVRASGRSPSFWLLGVVVGVVCITNFASKQNWLGDGPSQVLEPPTLGNAPLQFQEGEELPDTIGRFRWKDGRVRFLTHSSESLDFICLENAMLERIAQSALQSTEARAWIVTGRISRYRGQHYLFITSVASAPSKIAMIR